MITGKMQKSKVLSCEALYFVPVMTLQQINGKWGEDKAAAYLREIGFEIIVQNWRYKRAEIDIIARDAGILVFVEVKTRESVSFGRPEEMVDHRKRRLLIDAAMAYMRAVGYDWEIRFDIVAIHGAPGGPCEITLFKDAFFPGLDYK